MNRLVDTDEAAQLLGVSAEHVRRLVRRGLIPVVRAGRVFRFDIAAVVLALTEVQGHNKPSSAASRVRTTPDFGSITPQIRSQVP